MARPWRLRRLRPLTEPGRDPFPSPSFPMPLFTVLPAALSTVLPAGEGIPNGKTQNLPNYQSGISRFPFSR